MSITDLTKLFAQAFGSTEGRGKLVGDAILVQKLPERELKTSKGIILASDPNRRQITAFNADQPCFVKVLAVGAGYYDDKTGEDVPLDVKPGNVIELGRNSVRWFSSFGTLTGSVIGLTSDSSRRLVFDDESSYKKFMSHFEGPTVEGLGFAEGEI